jgi:hypothetical protein
MELVRTLIETIVDGVLRFFYDFRIRLLCETKEKQIRILKETP